MTVFRKGHQYIHKILHNMSLQPITFFCRLRFMPGIGQFLNLDFAFFKIIFSVSLVAESKYSTLK